MTSSPPGPTRPLSPSPSQGASSRAFPSRPSTPSRPLSPSSHSMPPSPSMQPEKLERSRAEQMLLSLLEREHSLLTVLEREQRLSLPGQPRRRQRSFTFSDVDRSASPTRPSTPVHEPRSSPRHLRPTHAAAPGKKRSIGESMRKEHGSRKYSTHDLRARNASGTSLQSIESMDSVPDVDIVSLVERSIALRGPHQRLAPHFSTSPVLRAVDAPTTRPIATASAIQTGAPTPGMASSSSSVRDGTVRSKATPVAGTPPNSPPKRPETPHKASPRPPATHHRSSSAIPKTLSRPALPHRAASEALTQATSRSLDSSGGMTMTRPDSRRSGQLEPSPKIRTLQQSKNSPAASPATSSLFSIDGASGEPSPPSFDLNDGGSVLTPCVCGSSGFSDKRAPAICTCAATRPNRPAPGSGGPGATSLGSGITLRSVSVGASSAPLSSPISVGRSTGSDQTAKPLPIPRPTASRRPSDVAGGPVLITRSSGTVEVAWSAERASRKLKQQEGRVCFDEVLGIPEDNRGSGRRWSLW